MEAQPIVELPGSARKQRVVRWGHDNLTIGPAGLATAIESSMTSEQLEAYMTAFRIEEISQKLRADDVMPAYRDRSPSPEPEYDGCGRRVNTRAQRHRRRLEDERHGLVERALRTIPRYRPPHDYRRPAVFRDKVYVPAADFPAVNFIGQLLGPRGSSLRAVEARSGATVAIRGRGSVKEGRGRGWRSRAADDEQEPLHCLITADSRHKVGRARELVEGVIRMAASTPEHENARKRQQLRELAVMNGTFRDDEADDGGQGRLIAEGRLIADDGHAGRLVAGHGHADGQRRLIAGHGHADGQPAQDKTARDTLDREIQQLMSEIGHSGPADVARHGVGCPPRRAGRYK